MVKAVTLWLWRLDWETHKSWGTGAPICDDPSIRTNRNSTFSKGISFSIIIAAGLGLGAVDHLDRQNTKK
ncbi:MAG TPA: hypothetical protein DC047_05910 [Blastocatellia bacterium]|nr:hypothetical protein [Blastocatellia bacterium]